MQDIKVGLLSFSTNRSIWFSFLGNDWRMCWTEIWIELLGNTTQRSNSLGCWFPSFNFFLNLQVYSNDERVHFLSAVLSNICYLAVNVDKICSRVWMTDWCDGFGMDWLLLATAIATRSIESNSDYVSKTSSFIISLCILLSLSSTIWSENRQWIWELSQSKFQFVRLGDFSISSPWNFLFKVISWWKIRWNGMEIGKTSMCIALFQTDYREK